jgi:hypothetical protein
MDDIMNALSQAMSDPATAAQVNGLISALSGGGQATEQSPQTAPPADTDMAKLMKIGTAMMQGGQNDPNIALILALKPLLKEETRMKADRIVKIFRLLSAYPLLKESGLI